MIREERLARRPRLFVALVACTAACSLLSATPVTAQEGFAGLCALFAEQNRVGLEDVELEVRQEEIRLAVAEEIYQLLEDLWTNDLVERLPYLGVKHRRDVARLSLERTRHQVNRQQAVADQYLHACTGQTESSDGRSLEEIQQQYLDAECEVRALDVAIFEVDLEYQREVLDSAQSLRQNDIASRQQVLFAERDVGLTVAQLEQARRRISLCGG